MPTARNVAYQWYRSDQFGRNYRPIPGATSLEYVLQEADAGCKVKLRTIRIGNVIPMTKVAGNLANMTMACEFEVVKITRSGVIYLMATGMVSRASVKTGKPWPPIKATFGTIRAKRRADDGRLVELHYFQRPWMSVIRNV